MNHVVLPRVKNAVLEAALAATQVSKPATNKSFCPILPYAAQLETLSPFADMLGMLHHRGLETG